MRGGLRDFASDGNGVAREFAAAQFHHFGESAVTFLVGRCSARRLISRQWSRIDCAAAQILKVGEMRQNVVISAECEGLRGAARLIQ
jgi:hypothetical protein